MRIRRNPTIGYRPNKVAHFLRRFGSRRLVRVYLHSARKLALMLDNSIAISCLYREWPLHPASIVTDATMYRCSIGRFGHAIALLELRKFHSPQ